ncbi:MAG: hypothetical protein A2946_02410 [Candidatus Liptonbacteria bacterium RIFCSPLOWO2_01_FULL_53_13]|uniref:Uncharacterized protein n=1 Tax=Candidatus Liptonbacteria bacterium RIFCSPLOWO2_01_FULL_53_13 TaxID=1798651 RepID=A0A1G2CPF2_9BACT|nr:MAG: hypothetical protein A2946_02410 [Candidatus Liptonbacteria bacterium RIFCSPLOWO2_01_FULL_53_13]
MEPSEEKFFEELAKFGSASREPDMNVGFAKATSAAIRKPASFASPEKIVEERVAKKPERQEEPDGQLTIDVYQTPEDIIVESAIAGVKPEDIDIDVSPDSITIRGARNREREINDEDYLYQECYWGRFSRSVILPQEVDADSASVTFKNGVLVVRLPKVVRRKTKKLRVSAE